MPNIIGVCSWSLRPASVEELIHQTRELDVNSLQLALTPLIDGAWDAERTFAALRSAGISVVSGMMQTIGEDYSTLESIRWTGGLWPDEHWARNLDHSRSIAALASAMEVPLVTLHAGFLPEEPEDPRRAVMLGRIHEIAGTFQHHGVGLGLETGQEDSSTLRAVLAELSHPGVVVNFDPANMILYGMGDPVEALQDLGEHVAQIHVKDALPSESPGTWGTETPVGRGGVDWKRFFDVLRRRHPSVHLMIERESGEDRLGDIRQARDVCLRHTGAGHE